MVKKTLTLVVLLAIGLAACSSTPSTEEAAENLCSSLDSLTSAGNAVVSLSPDSSVEEAEAAFDSVKDAWEDVKSDAEVVNEAAAQEADDAINDLNDAVNDVSGDATLSEAATQVVGAVQSFAAAIQQIGDSITCE